MSSDLVTSSLRLCVWKREKTIVSTWHIQEEADFIQNKFFIEYAQKHDCFVWWRQIITIEYNEYQPC
jgi:hypothetical protein